MSGNLSDRLKFNKESFFYFAWILMEIHICTANSDAEKFSSPIISYISLLVFCLKIVLTKYRKREIIMIVLLLIGSIVCFRTNSDMRVVWFVLVIAASKKIDFNKIVKYSLRTMIICCFVFLMLYFLRVTEGVYIVSNRGERLSFGLGHPNICSAYYGLIIIQYIYIHFEQIKVRHLLLFALGALPIYLGTKSNTGFLVTVLALIFVFIIKVLPAKQFNTKIIVIGLLGGIAFFTFAPIFYNNSLNVLDSMMTGRLHQANYYYEIYGIHIFGSDITHDLMNPNRDNILDIGIAKMLINNGIFYYTLVVGGYTICLKKAISDNRKDLLALFGTMIIYLFAENVATYIFMNVSMLAFSQLIFCNKKQNYSVSIGEQENLQYERYNITGKSTNT